MDWLVHICSSEDWQAAGLAGVYRPISIDREGFIHASRSEQIIRVANQFYRGLSNLRLLWIDPGRVQAEIRWESVGEEVFPHIYGPLNLGAVVTVSDFLPDPDGVYRNLPDH